MEEVKSQATLLDTARRASRFGFLEPDSDAVMVVTSSMQVLYLNAAARTLLPLRWFGSPCWEIFPVGDEGCASRCPTVKAVSAANDIRYFEETFYRRSGLPTAFGVAVIPLAAGKDGERALLLFRERLGSEEEGAFQRRLLERAAELKGKLES